MVGPMKIPVHSLSEASLRGIVEAFVLREGTDYGTADHSFAGKCAQVLAALGRGEAQIDFDPLTESVNIQPADGPAGRQQTSDSRRSHAP